MRTDYLTSTNNIRGILKTILIVVLFVTYGNLIAQVSTHTPLDYAFNGTPTHGVKIKTNLPFAHGSQMPTIIIEGYNYGLQMSIGLTINWYVYNNEFIRHNITSHGAYTPNVKLAVESGKVIIYIDERQYYNRFTIRAFGKSRTQDIEANYQNWTAVDEPLSGCTHITPLIYNSWKKTHSSIASSKNINYEAGNVGVGTTAPDMKLSVRAVDKYISRFHSSDSNSLMTGIRLGRVTTAGASYADLVNTSNGFGISAGYSGGNLPLNTQNTSDIAIFTTYNTKNVGIGTVNPGDWKLAVNGKIRAKEIKVETVGWSDFVFENNYKLPTLEEVERHIKSKGHLKDIPSAKEVSDNGILLGEMDSKLLQKIEELMLYTIEQQKQIELLKLNNQIFREELKNLKNN